MPPLPELSDQRFKNFTIGSQRVGTTDRLVVLNPASGEVLTRVPCAEPQHLELAIAEAQAARQAWQALSYEQREALLEKLAERMASAVDEFATLISLEQGKPHQAARDETNYAIGWLRDIARQRLHDEILEDSAHHLVEQCHVPLGVVGLIVPWNFPLCLAIWKLAPALITGNTAILKPSPYTPLSALKLAELASDILPAGVLTVLTGTDELGQWMVDHPDIAKISFTGSVATGSKVMAGAARHLKRLTLELGGNDPAIVLPDVDIDDVVPRLDRKSVV